MTVEQRAEQMDRLAEKYLRLIKWELGDPCHRETKEKKVKTLLLSLMVEARKEIF